MINYTQALEIVYSTINPHPHLDTERATRSAKILKRTGEPQSRVPAIHVTGTKGKGSVAAMLAASLTAQGLRVGLYTSPHIHSLRERIQVNGIPIATDAFAALVERLQPTFNEVEETSFPEAMTALAFHHFANESVDIAVVEVHVGGIYDATNVITPVCSVINTIDYDHIDVLGHTLTDIATHKAGIIKLAVPVVSAPQKTEVLTVLKERAVALNAPLTVVGTDIPFTVNPPERTQQTITFDGEPHTTNLLGAHQGANLALTLATLRALPAPFVPSPLPEQLTDVYWPGRLEIVGKEPLTLLDIAHNPAAAATLRQYRDTALPNTRWWFVFGSKPGKDVQTILTTITRPGDTVILTRVTSPATLPPLKLYDTASVLDNTIALLPHDDVRRALQVAQVHAAPEDIICVTGSIFIVAAARAVLMRIPPEEGSAH